MKKPILLISSIALIGALIYWVSTLTSSAGKSTNSELIEFAFDDTASITKVIIEDFRGKSFEIKRNGVEWTDKDGGCILQESVKNILYVLKNIEFKGYLPENSMKTHIKMLSTIATQVKFYTKEKWVKTWFIGTSSADHLGQIMLLDNENGKSDLPVLMKVKGMNGIIEPNFYSDSRKWKCTEIFKIPADQIKAIDIKIYDDPGRSFKVEKNGSKFKVAQNGQNLPFSDTIAAFRYLNNFKRINYFLPNYVLDKKQQDSLLKSEPFGSMKILETTGKTTFLKFFRITGEESFDEGFGEIPNVDLNNFWCLLPNKELVKCQYFVFDPLIRGDLYFPMNPALFKYSADLSNRE